MVLGRPDVWPAGDMALQAAVAEVKGLGHRPDAVGDGRARRGVATVAVRRGAALLARLPRPPRAARLDRRRQREDARRTIAACTGVTTLSSQPDLPSHVQRIVDEIENEIGDEPNRPAAIIEGIGSDGGHGANGRVEAAVHEILTEIGEDPDRAGPDRHAGVASTGCTRS